MKRAILGYSCLLLLSLGALTTAAQGPQGAGVEGKKVKTHWHWWHHEKHRKDKTPPLYTTPKSVGWWHRHGPGPAGAGTR